MQSTTFLFLLMTNIVREDHLVWVGPNMFPASILSILALSNSLVFGTAQYGAECTGSVSGFNSSVQCFAILMRPE